MDDTLWILKKTDNKKFPYKLYIKKGEEVLLSLAVGDRWPGARGHIFCLRSEPALFENEEEIERVKVLSLQRYGKRLAVILDRSINKRCDFLFLTKMYKNGEGMYEQIFWRTQKGLTERKPRVKLTAQGESDIHVLIDTQERYGWKFTDCTVEKKSLPAGDYGLLTEEGIIAVVERKTYDNMLNGFADIHILHQKLGEMESYRHAALIIEANYSDFLNADKIRYYKPSFAAKVIGELYTLHPDVQIVFAGNRKLANEWTLRFFKAVKSHQEDHPHYKISETIARYGESPENRGGSYFELHKEINEKMPLSFTFAMLKKEFPFVKECTLRRVLNKMREEKTIEKQGDGQYTKWLKKENSAL